MYLGYELVKGDVSGTVIGFSGDGHMLTIGPTRTGKSRRLLIPNLLFETGRSVLAVDIKGELAAITAAHRASKGGRVVALDPFGVLAERAVKIETVGFNPMTALNPADDAFVDDAMAIAEALIQVSPGAKEPHFAEAAQDFVCGIIMLVRCQAGQAANLGMVRREISRSPEEIELIARQYTANPPHAGIYNKLAKFTEAKGNKEIASILSTATTQTRFLDSPPITRNLASGGVDFATLKTKTETIYLVLPPSKLMTHAKWLRLVIGAAMAAMQRTAKNDKRPDVLFMLDEFAQLGRLQSIETAVSLNAGYGVKVWAAVQNLGQLKDQYGENWETFLSAGCLTAFAPRDLFTREHLTKLIGTGSRAMRSVSRDADGKVSVSQSVQKDDLVSPQDWRSMIMGEHWAFIPTERGQVIKYLWSPDFTKLPDVESGKIRVAA